MHGRVQCAGRWVQSCGAGRTASHPSCSRLHPPLVEQPVEVPLVIGLPGLDQEKHPPFLKGYFDIETPARHPPFFLVPRAASSPPSATHSDPHSTPPPPL